MSLKIYTIDDDSIVLFLMKKLLKKTDLGQERQFFSSALPALEHFMSEYSLEHHYVFLLDINMPGMNGWEFLEATQTFVKTQNICVYIMSSSTDSADFEKAHSFDIVQDFLVKPVLASTLEGIKDEFKS